MKDLKEKFQRFMTGRYGAYGLDKLNRFLAVAILVLIIVNLFVRSKTMYWLELIGFVYYHFRMFSKNFKAREEENRVYMSLQIKVQDTLMKWKFYIEQARAYHIYKCPNCGQKIRIPRGKGKVSIHCPKCQTDFIRKS